MQAGADGRDVLGHVLRRALAMIAAGLLIGLAGALTLTRVMTGLLFQASALDPLVLGSAATAMLCVGLVAAAVPARRAARVNPTTVLQSEG